MRQSIRALFRSLSRVTTSGRFIPQIDGLRFVAIIVVILFHISCTMMEPVWASKTSNIPQGDPLWQLCQLGYVGVQLFFGISGFILCLPFAEYYLNRGRPVSLKSYYLRRVTRLEPTYFANLIILFAARLVLMGDTFSETLPHLVPSFFYHHWLVFWGSHPAGMTNQVGWSLEIEIQFYILAPLLAKLFLIPGKVPRRLVLVALMFTAACARQLLVPPWQRHGWTIGSELTYFLVGFLLADLYLVEWKQRPRPSWAWDLAGTLAWLAMIPTVYYWKLNAFALPPLILVAYISVFRGVMWPRIASNPWLTTIGGMCYTIYLYHLQMILFACKVTARAALIAPVCANLLVQALILVPMILVLCAVLFAVAERPFMQKDWPARFREWVARRLHPPRSV